MSRMPSNSNNHAIHSNRVTDRFESGLEAGSRPHSSEFGFESEAFRIRQSNPPLTGQRGWGNNRNLSIAIDSKSGNIDANRFQQSILPLPVNRGQAGFIDTESIQSQPRRGGQPDNRLSIPDFGFQRTGTSGSSIPTKSAGASMSKRDERGDPNAA